MFYNGKLFTIYKIKFIAIIRHLAFLLDSDSLTVTLTMHRLCFACQDDQLLLWRCGGNL